MKIAMLSLLLCSCCAVAQKDAQKYTVEVEHRPKMVVVCRALVPGEVVGGGDNCDFHSHPDPVFCRVFPREKGCGKHPELLPNQCGTSFGCQNLDAVVPKGH